MKVRILSAGWETFTGSLGFRAEFKDGVSVSDLDQRQIARIGSNLRIVDIETGLQVGPSVVALAVQSAPAPVVPELQREDVRKAEKAETVAELVAQEQARKEADEAAFKEAMTKAEGITDEIVVYSRQELEAIGSNDGIEGLREIAKPLGVKARSITDMVEAILKAQVKAMKS